MVSAHNVKGRKGLIIHKTKSLVCSLASLVPPPKQISQWDIDYIAKEIFAFGLGLHLTGELTNEAYG